jgi:hypothetical protein
LFRRVNGKKNVKERKECESRPNAIESIWTRTTTKREGKEEGGKVMVKRKGKEVERKALRKRGGSGDGYERGWPTY